MTRQNNDPASGPVSRRDFLRVGATGLGAAALVHAVPRTAAQSEEAPPGAARVRQTAGAQRYAERPSVAWRPAGAAKGDIRIDPSRRFQEVLGFGAAFTDAACYMFN